MKNIFLMILVIVTISCKAQNIRTLNTVSFDLNQGDYVEDSNYEFDPYLGTWEGTWNNKKITLYLSKVTHHYVEEAGIGFYYKDFVMGKYIVVDLSTGIVLEDTTNITNVESMPIESSVLVRNKNQLWFLYMNKFIDDCGILSTIILTRDLTNPSILTYKYFVKDYRYEGCPYTNLDDIPVNIPKQQVVFHKL